VDYEKKQYLCTQKVTDMEGNLQNESLLRVAHELAQMGQKSGRALTEGEILPVLEQSLPMIRPEVTEVRPQALECDVVRFQNNKEKWVALVGLLDGYPYEIFTGLQDDEEGIILPKTVTHGKIIKQVNPDGTKRYDFQFENKRGYKTTVEGLSEKFNPEYWNYAKLISGVLRYRMPLEHVIKLVASLSLKDESINTWKTGVERALKKYIPGVHDELEIEE
jgi:ribonucleoside-diphosphate reductase alpha chain